MVVHINKKKKHFTLITREFISAHQVLVILVTQVCTSECMLQDKLSWPIVSLNLQRL